MKGPGFYGEDFFRIKQDKDLIRENIIRVLLTSPGERPMSSFGCRLKDFLMEQSNVFQDEVEDEVSKAISRWEPRVALNNLEIEVVEANRARVKIDCTIRENFEDFSIDTIIRF